LSCTTSPSIATIRSPSRRPSRRADCLVAEQSAARSHPTAPTRVDPIVPAPSQCCSACTGTRQCHTRGRCSDTSGRPRPAHGLSRPPQPRYRWRAPPPTPSRGGSPRHRSRPRRAGEQSFTASRTRAPALPLLRGHPLAGRWARVGVLAQLVACPVPTRPDSPRDSSAHRYAARPRSAFARAARRRSRCRPRRPASAHSRTEGAANLRTPTPKASQAGPMSCRLIRSKRSRPRGRSSRESPGLGLCGLPGFRLKLFRRDATDRPPAARRPRLGALQRRGSGP
jgi:hypothetical protein